MHIFLLLSSQVPLTFISELFGGSVNYSLGTSANITILLKEYSNKMTASDILVWPKASVLSTLIREASCSRWELTQIYN